jgi:hypothetical protein
VDSLHRNSFSFYISLLAVTLTATASCGELTIDGSSEETYKKSSEDMYEQLSPEQQEPFQKAILAILLDGHDMFSAAAIMDQLGIAMRMKIHGKTYAEILAIAKELGRGPAEEKLKKLQAELVELEEKNLTVQELRTKLTAVEVISARHFYREGRSTPTKELVLRNGLDFPLSVIRYHYVISSPGREHPWKKDRGIIPLGRKLLSPGEERSLSFEGEPEIPKDAADVTVVVTVVGVEGPGGDPPFSEGKPKIETSFWNKYTEEYDLDANAIIQELRQEIHELEGSLAGE